MKIKICGLFRDDDIDFVNDARPDFAGFVFAKSKRQVNAKTAERLRQRLGGGIIPVGVFVNVDVDAIAGLYRDDIISIAQLHGGEDARYIGALKDRCDVQVIKAVKPEAGKEGEHFEMEFPSADYFLFDSSRAGSGIPFDWNFLKSHAALLESRGFLAGGINCGNIDEAIKRRPWCVDISSGAETNGVKDAKKITRLVQSVRPR
jgi:phosphoribosylanthranilate isomerase